MTGARMVLLQFSCMHTSFKQMRPWKVDIIDSQDAGVEHPVGMMDILL